MTDTDLQPFRELASGRRQLAGEAQRIYAAEVTAIIRHRCRDTQQTRSMKPRISRRSRMF